MARIFWGVDSASAVTNEAYNCVVNNFGKPNFWGRYLKTVPKAADGLTAKEISLLKSKNVKILPVYSDFKQAIGFSNGRKVARNAIFNAQSLGCPKGVILFANIEHYFKVDEAWIRGWVDTIYTSGYRPGLYHDPKRGNFSAAFCEAVKNSERVKLQAILWSSAPLPGVSGPSDAPQYAPSSPPCQTFVWAWQYGKDAENCSIDTNLVKEELYTHLW